MKSLFPLFVFMCFYGCASVSKQYYYEPSIVHQQLKGRPGHTDYRMLYSKFLITGKAGDTIGSVTTDNGTGQPFLMGPLLPVIPVGGFFQKSRGNFMMGMTVNCTHGQLVPLDSTRCYMIVNDTTKIPLHVNELAMRDTSLHSYSFYCGARFSKIKSMRLVTGNNLLDGTLKNIAFNRKSRIKFDLVGPGY